MKQSLKEIRLAHLLRSWKKSTSYFTSELIAKWYTLRVSPNAVPYKLISSHSSSLPFHTQTQSFWHSEHSRLILWQLFLKQTHTQPHADTHRDPDRGISWGVSMGASAVLWASVPSWQGDRGDRVAERERVTVRWNNEGDEGINSWHHCSRKISLLAESLCGCAWEVTEGRGMQRMGTGIEPGWDGEAKAYKMRPRRAQWHASRTRSKSPSHPSSFHLLWNLSMDIPIQYPWYRRSFPHRLGDLSMAEPLTDWPLIWPLSWSFPWMRPSFMRWFNWFENGHSEVKQNLYANWKHVTNIRTSITTNICVMLHVVSDYIIILNHWVKMPVNIHNYWFLTLWFWNNSYLMFLLNKVHQLLFLMALLSVQMRIEKDRYVIYCDVKHFSPDELSVSVSDEFITIHARHEERQVRASLRDDEIAFGGTWLDWHGDSVFFLGWPRLCVKRVSEEIQASCWRVRRWGHLQSVSRWRAYNHRTPLVSRRAHHSHCLWRWNSETENLKQSQTLPARFHY